MAVHPSYDPLRMEEAPLPNIAHTRTASRLKGLLGTVSRVIEKKKRTYVDSYEEEQGPQVRWMDHSLHPSRRRAKRERSVHAIYSSLRGAEART